MRAFVFLVVSVTCCFAQQTEKKLLDRVTAKRDMSLLNPMNGKKFETGGASLGKRDAGRQSSTTRNFPPKRSDRSLFLGLKNPWAGKMVDDSRQVSLWPKTLVANEGKKFPVESAEAAKFHQADRKAARREEPVKTSAYLAGAACRGPWIKSATKSTRT